MDREKSQKDILIDELLDTLDIENEFYKTLNMLIDLQLDCVLSERQLEQVDIFCKQNLTRLVNKKKKEYRVIYSDFSETELSDIIIFHKSTAGMMLKSKSAALSDIVQSSLLTALDNKNLNILLDQMLDDLQENIDSDNEELDE